MQRDEPPHEENQGQDAGGCDAKQGGVGGASVEEDPKAMYERLNRVVKTPDVSHEDILASLNQEVELIKSKRSRGLQRAIH